MPSSLKHNLSKNKRKKMTCRSWALGLSFALGLALGQRFSGQVTEREIFAPYPVTFSAIKPKSPRKKNVPRLVTYVTGEGDTPQSLARTFSTTAESIAAINNLPLQKELEAGCSLIFLENGSGLIKRVSPDESLKDIADSYGISLNAIMDANDLEDPWAFLEGQILILPTDDFSSQKTRVASAQRAYTGKLSWPVKGDITSPFGERIHPVSGLKESHMAIDIAASAGTPIKASAKGTVVFADWQQGYGQLLVLDHGDDLETRYGHLRSYKARLGDKVEAGDVIGYVGETGVTTGPHLHFEIRVKGVPYDPRLFLPNKG